MKPLFQSKPLHLTACILLFWKGISLIAWILLQESGMHGIGEDFFFSTGFMSSFCLMVIGAFSDSRTLSFVVIAVICLVFMVYWVFFVLLAINRPSAGTASVGLLVLCGLDLPITAAFSLAGWWRISFCIVFHAAVFITVALLRRSRQGVPTQLSETPASI